MNRNNRSPNRNESQVPDLMGNAQLVQNSQIAGYTGFEIFGDQEFVRYPIIGVNQPTSDYKPEGRFHNRVTGEVYDTIEVVFLALCRSMSYRPHGYGDPVPACFSSNALRPDASVEQPVHQTCHRVGPRGLVPECPNAHWVRNSDNKAKRACDLRYTAAVDFRGEHYLMYFQGRSIAPLERFLSQMRQFRQPLFGLNVSLGLTYRTKREGFMGNFYEMNFPDLSNPSERERIQVIDAASFQDSAMFFKNYFETAPSEVHLENTEDVDKPKAPLKQGIRYVEDSRDGQNNRNDQYAEF